jgi:hypothetical protein
MCCLCSARYLLSGNASFYEHLGRFRSFNDKLSTKEAALVLNMLDGDHAFEPGSDREEVAEHLRHMGYLIKTDTGMYAFPSPLHKHFYLVRQFRAKGSRLTELQDTREEFETFIRLSIRAIRASALSKSVSRGLKDCGVYERHFQMEW